MRLAAGHARQARELLSVVARVVETVTRTNLECIKRTGLDDGAAFITVNVCEYAVSAEPDGGKNINEYPADSSRYTPDECLEDLVQGGTIPTIRKTTNPTTNTMFRFLFMVTALD